MSENENVRIDKLEEKVELIYLSIQGNTNMGIEGLIPLLHRHMRESKENFRNFKRDITLDYVTDVNNITNRLIPLEKAEQQRHRTAGIFAGVGVVVGFGASFVWDLIKPLL